MPTEAKKLQWMQPYLTGVSNSIKKFSVAFHPLQEIANFDYALHLDRIAAGQAPLSSGGSGGSHSWWSGSTQSASASRGGGDGGAGTDGVVCRQIYIASQFFLPQNMKAKSSQQVGR
jgi:hypothetical protein